MANIEEETLVRKLHPSRYPGMSGLMAAIVGCILGRQFTEPAIAGLVLTCDGYVLAWHGDDIGCNQFIGSRSDLERNWEGLLDVAGLTDDERQLAECKYRQHIVAAE
jgi:hypothetical protein